MTDQTLKDIDRAFKALEERDELLDKIRAEIASLVKIKLNIIYPCEYNDALESVLQIIDCYRNEVNE